MLRKIALEERSGDLQVIFGQTIKTIYFDRGFVVLAASNLKSDRLGESLIERGRISRHELALATMLMKTGQKKIGQALVQAGVMAEEELGRSVALQVNRIALSLFKATDGIYSFDERPTNIPMKLMVSLSIYRILLEGIRRMTKGNLILQGLPPLDTVLRVSEQPPFTIDFGQLKPVEQSVLRAAGRGVVLQSITEGLGHDQGRVLRACYGLLCAGLLEESETDRTPRPLKVQEETGVFLLSDLEKKFAKIQATTARQEILMEFDHLGEMAEADLLQIDRKADMEDIRQAYESRRKEWSIKRNLVEQERSLIVKVDEIQARLERAYQQMLSDHSAPSPPLSNQAAAEWSAVGIEFAESDVLDQTGEGETIESSPAQRARAQEAIEKVQELEDARQAQQIQEAQRTNEEDELEIEVETGEFDTPALPPLIEDEPEEASFIKNEVELQLGSQIELEVEEAAAPAEIEIDDDASHAQLKIDEEAAGPGIEIEVEVDVEEDTAPKKLEARSDSTPKIRIPKKPKSLETIVEEETVPSGTEAQEEAASAADIEIEFDEETSEPADTKPNVRDAGMSSSEDEDRSEAPHVVQKELLPEQRDERVRQLFRDVKLHFTVRDWDGAVSLLMELVELEPNNAHHHGMLAKAMLRHPVMRTNAERHFIEALRLDPQDADLHYWLGLYYKTFGLKSRAETEFRTALRIDPKHAGAHKYLTGGGKRKDPLSNLFGKIFG